MPDAAAVVDGHPAGAAGGVHQGVQQRPVGDRVGAVAHAPRSPGRARRPSRSPGGRGRSRSGALSSPAATISLKRSAQLARARRSRASRSAPAAPGSATCSRGQLDPAARGARCRGNSSQDRPVGGGDVGRVARQRRPSGTAPCPRRTAAGCRRARSRDSRTRRSYAGSARPGRAGCCRSRTPRRPRRCSATIARARARPSTRAHAVAGTRRGRCGAARRPARRSCPPGT